MSTSDRQGDRHTKKIPRPKPKTEAETDKTEQLEEKREKERIDKDETYSEPKMGID